MRSDDDTRDSPLLSGIGAGAIAGRYQLRARLGRGATKEVYLAYDERLDREVAIALVVAAGDTAAARARVEREAQVTGRLGDHPHVITVYDTGDHDGLPYLVLRAMSGGSLADLLGRERPSFADVIRVGGEIASALAHAHAHGVVHRDVKPDNVWLAADGSAALGDFGIAHQTGLDRLTAEGVVVGTVRYLSPEQVRGDEIGPACDLYALGVTLYELAAGRPPFIAADPRQVLIAHLATEPAPPSRFEPSIPAGLERLILGLIAKEAADRPPSAAAVADALRGMGARARRPDARRLVSVLAVRADVADPEALHGVFERCAAAIEQHGGTIERYLGDALVGFFGLAESHDDDALRAARAAVELRADGGELRLGIEAGEVFVGAGLHGAPIATGAAITAAGRLADLAGPGEILLGDRIRRAVASAAKIDPDTGRLDELTVERRALMRPGLTPFVGRDRELAELGAAFRRVREDRTCNLVTVIGPPGIGKSRLAGEFVAGIGDQATVLAGRCLAYGEGTTYRALADIVRGLGDRRLDELLGDDEAARRAIRGAVGLSDDPVRVEETSWAVRRLIQRLARDGPVVVAVEDIHWAEPALLDLLDHVVALSSGSAILLVCLARPDLLETRPGWTAPQPNRAVLLLDALAEAQARRLAEVLGAAERAERIALRAEGNPLFVEQLVAVDADGELPASIQAVLNARIDRLAPGEQMLLQRAAVEGRTFHTGALAELLPAHERGRLPGHLVALSRKGLIGADRPEVAGEEAFRFTHALIREAAYAAVPKLLRAEIHGGVARWLEARPAVVDEIVGFHLEQACRFAAELGRPEPEFAVRAVERFESAARTALARGDPTAAVRLFERAIDLVDDDAALRGALQAALGASLFEAGRMTAAARVLDEAIARAPNPRLAALAQVEREFVRLEADATGGFEHARSVADAVMPVLERDGDDRALSRVWCLRAQVAWNAGQIGRADAGWRNAAACSKRVGDEREFFDTVMRRASAAVFGPTPVDEGIRLCEEIGEMVRLGPVAAAATAHALASLYAMRGEFECARQLLHAANETRHTLGDIGSSVSHHEAFVDLLAGLPELAEELLRGDLEKLERMGDIGMLATTKAMLAQAVYAQGRRREAELLCLAAARAAAPDDIVTQVVWRGVQARVSADTGQGEMATRMAHDAVLLVSSTDLITHHADAMIDLAYVLHVGEDQAQARRAARTGLALYERKGNRAGAARATSMLAH